MRSPVRAALVALLFAAVSAAARAEPQTAIGDWLDGWFDRVDAAQSSEPGWLAPMLTPTPRLDEKFRYDQGFFRQGNGDTLAQFGGGKGLALISGPTTELQLYLPSYLRRDGPTPAQGWGDWPFLTVKQRLMSAPADAGDYVVTAFLGLQAPSGAAPFSANTWTATPAIGGGKGWGDLDVQGTVGLSLPADAAAPNGSFLTAAAALQYFLAPVFWPEVELGVTHWLDGLRGGKTQTVLAPGLLLGRFPLGGRLRASFGVAYEAALTPKLVRSPALTPQFDHGWLGSARLSF